MKEAASIVWRRPLSFGEEFGLGWLVAVAASLLRRGRVGLRCGAARGDSELDSKDGSNWSALKLNAMPAVRWRMRVGVGWQQLTPWGGSTGVSLENIFLLFIGSHGK
ncbi:hypothetical protein [Tunturiibacter gelidiferens]|uniref:hypothetical protein n=1 Tax=Tunturiibacter gelidiferens TaxID=3069689 RepID=UPI003D9AB9E0